MQIDEMQMATLTAHVRAAGNRRIAHYIAARFPDAFGSRDETQRVAIVERLRGIAAGYGLERDDHVGTFADLSLMYGGDFVSMPWAAPILTDSTLGAAEKIRVLVERVRASGGQV